MRIASFMQYTPNASGTQGLFAYQALQKHFDYTAAYVTKAIEGPTRFAEILRQELLNGCPVYLEGRPAGAASGHAWVTDGFDANGLFHMNFGWEGQGDAYYSLTNLNVSQTGSEFEGKPLAFNRAITAILAHPNNGACPDIDRALLDDFLPMKKAPVIEVELANGTGRISEKSHKDAHFQLMAQPTLRGNAEQGAKVQAIFTVKNLNGVPRDCYLRVQLLDESKAIVLDTRADNATEIEGFTEANIPVVLQLPASLAPAQYEVRLQASTDEAETLPCPINNIHDKDAAYIEVMEAQERPLMAKVEVFIADDSNDKIESGYIDVSQGALFKLGVSLRTTEDRTYEGLVTMLCEDLETGEKIQIKGINDNITVYPSFDVPLFSTWLRKSNMPFEDAHTYQVMVMGQIDGEDVELKTPEGPTYCLKRDGNIVSVNKQISTGIHSATPAGAPLCITRKGSELSVSADGMRHLRLFNLSGILLKQVPAADTSHASLSLQGISQGVYLLQVETKGGLQTYRMAL